MRTDDEYRQILLYWEQGNDQSHIARLTGIPRATVGECVKRFRSVSNFNAARLQSPNAVNILDTLKNEGLASLVQLEAYSYLLGLYLGDGHITKAPRTFKLRIFLATEYPIIINCCIQAIDTLLPDKKAGMIQGQGNYVEVYSLSNYWPEFFPQHGTGAKHTRAIILEDWQQSIVQKYPLLFFKGLYHSDGSRPSNIVKGKDYPRYEFKNNSDDIRRLFSDTCNLLGLHWTVGSGGMTIQIAKRADVAFLDQHIGPKS